MGRRSGNKSAYSRSNLSSSIRISVGASEHMRFLVSATGGALRTGPVSFIFWNLTFCVIPCAAGSCGRIIAKNTGSPCFINFAICLDVTNCLVVLDVFAVRCCTVISFFPFRTVRSFLPVLPFIDLHSFCSLS